MSKLLKIFTIFWLASFQPSKAETIKDTPIDLIIEWHKEQCAKEVLAVNRLNSSREVNFYISKDSIYELKIGVDTQATIVYRSFTCSEYGHYWCGSGGCGFFIVVGEQIFYRSLSYKPAAINLQNDQNSSAVVFGLHGINCIGANGADFFGYETCYVLMTWNDRERTFQSTIPSVIEVILVDDEWVPVANLK